MFIKYLDYLSPTVTFYHKGFLSHSSIVSGILSIISFLLIIILAGYFSLDLILRRNPTAFFYNSFVDDAGVFPLNSSSFFHFVSLAVAEDNYIDNGVDFQNFRVIGFEDFAINYFLDKNISHFNHWLYGYCDDKNDIQGIENLINYDFFKRSACIRKYFDKNDQSYYDIKDPKFRWHVIAHGTFNKNEQFYSLILERCHEETIDYIMGKGYHCKTNQEFNQSLGITSNAHFFFIDQYIDVLNYTHPNIKYIYRIENNIQLNMYPINHLNFNPIFVQTHNGLVFDRSTINTAYTYERNDVYSYESKGNEIYTIYYLWLNNRQNYYKRSYKRIQDVISDIGGISQFINITAFFINLFYNKYIVLFDTDNLLFSSIESEKNKIDQVRDYSKQKINNNPKTTAIKDKSKNIIQHDINNNKANESHINKSSDHCIKKNEESNNKTYIKLVRTLNNNKSINNESVIIGTKKKKITFWSYFLFKISYGKKYTYFKGFEEFRKKIISEEHLMKNHLNIYNLLKYSKKKRNYRRNSYRLKDLINLV